MVKIQQGEGVMIVEIRGKQDQVQVKLLNYLWDNCMKLMEEKLMNLKELRIESIYVYVLLPMTVIEIRELFQMVRKEDICIAKISYLNQGSMIETVDHIGVGNFHYDHDVLILGDISPHTSLTLHHGNLYVFGKVSGDIEFLSKKSKLYAQRIEKLRIKFNDLPIQYVEWKENCILEYKTRKDKGKWQDQL
ncbi:MAG: hypothetical protein PUF50_08055 [Erysipelotrichaceae bacterium]|nr:hypothetical protein [Erysipelotrichaceae bacterium]